MSKWFAMYKCRMCGKTFTMPKHKMTKPQNLLSVIWHTATTQFLNRQLLQRSMVNTLAKMVVMVLLTSLDSKKKIKC